MQQLKSSIVVITDYEQSERFKQDIINIWKTCFGDSEEYINLFLKNNLVGNCVLWLEDNIAVSMLFLIDCNLKIKENTYFGKYIYAVATLPQYRNKGYTTKLLDFVNSTLATNQSYDFTVLVPSEKELFNFYGKRGYQTDLFCEKGNVKKDKQLGNIYKLTNINYVEYKNLRDKFLKDNYIIWNEEFIKYCFSENELCGGKQIKIYQNQQEVAIAIVAKIKNNLVVKEIIFKNNFINKNDVFKVLLNEFNCESLQYRCNFNEQSLNKQPFGMIKWQDTIKSNIKYSYIGLVLD